MNAVVSTSDRPAPVSTYALLSVLCSLAVFCPLLTMLGVALGVKALADIRAQPWLRGRGLAWTGIVIGLTSTTLIGCAAYWWHVHVRTPMMEGPVAALRAGYAGDYDEFRAWFTGEGAEASDEQVAAFFRELDRRYGRLLTMTQDFSAEAAAPPEEAGLSPYVPYVFCFERDNVAGEAELVLFASGLYPRWKSIIIREQAGEERLVFPPGIERRWSRQDSGRTEEEHGD